MLAIGAAKAEFHLCEAIPGMNFSKADGIWRAPLSWPVYVAMCEVWSGTPLPLAPNLDRWAGEMYAWYARAWELRELMEEDSPQLMQALTDIESGRAANEGGPMLLPFQRGGVQWLTEMRRAVLEDPQGNGKTPQAIRAFQVLRASPGGLDAPALVIAPPATLLNWQREFGRWAPELSARVIMGSALKRRKAIMDEGPADVYIIGWQSVRLHTRIAPYPGLRMKRCTEHGGDDPAVKAAACEVHEKELNAIRWGAVIPDEAHRMQDGRSKQTRAVWHLAHQAPYFWPLTGTPVADNIGNLWPILHGVTPQGFPSRSRYLDLWAVKNMAWHGGTEILGVRPETSTSFQAATQCYLRRIPKELARPQMPKRLDAVFRNPEMTPAQARMYKQLSKELLADIEESGTTMVPANSGVKFARLCQLAAASIETYDGEDPIGFTKQQVRMIAPSHKVDDLLEFLEDNPGSLVVSCNSPQLVELCAAKLDAEKITNCRITGSQSPLARDQAVTWFQEGECRVILITPRAGGEGITLTASDTVLWLQPTPSFREWEQVMGRVDRIGQENPVRHVYSVTPGSVEERLYQLGQDKTERAAQVTMDAELLKWMVGGGDYALGENVG